MKGYRMNMQELEQIIENMPYTLSGSQDIGWLIEYKDGRVIRVPVGMDYQVTIRLANLNR